MSLRCQVSGEAYGETPNQFAADAYDGIYALYNAAVAAGITTDTSAEDACDKMIEQFQTLTVDGLTGVSSLVCQRRSQQRAEGIHYQEWRLRVDGLNELNNRPPNFCLGGDRAAFVVIVKET